MNKNIQEMVLDTVGGVADYREAVVERLEPLIKKSIRMHYYGEMDYEDLLQEGRTRLLSEMDRFDPERKTIFLGVAQKSLQYLYCELRRVKIPVCLLNVCMGKDGDLREEIDLIADSAKVEEICALEELRGVVAMAVSKLKPSHREMVEDYFFKGKSLRQIATDRDIHYMTAVQRKRRALEELGKTLEKTGYGI